MAANDERRLILERGPKLELITIKEKELVEEPPSFLVNVFRSCCVLSCLFPCSCILAPLSLIGGVAVPSIRLSLRPSPV